MLLIKRTAITWETKGVDDELILIKDACFRKLTTFYIFVQQKHHRYNPYFHKTIILDMLNCHLPEIPKLCVRDVRWKSRSGGLWGVTNCSFLLTLTLAFGKNCLQTNPLGWLHCTFHHPHITRWLSLLNMLFSITHFGNTEKPLPISIILVWAVICF